VIAISSELQAHLASATPTVCRIWWIRRTDLEEFRFAELDQDVIYPGDGRYLAARPVGGSAARASLGLNVDNQEARGVFDAAAITEEDLEDGLWDHARVKSWIVNWADPSMGRVPLPGGRIGRVTYDGVRWRAELLGLTHLLATQVGRQLSPMCDWELGDSRCQQVLTSYTRTLTVTEVADRAGFHATLSGAAFSTEGFFDFGSVTWLTGENTGRGMEVKSQVMDGDVQFSLFLPMRRDIAVGDTATVVAGCDKSWATCQTKFGNGARFGGCPFLPGSHRLLALAGG